MTTETMLVIALDAIESVLPKGFELDDYDEDGHKISISIYDCRRFPGVCVGTFSYVKDQRDSEADQELDFARRLAEYIDEWRRR